MTAYLLDTNHLSAVMNGNAVIIQRMSSTVGSYGAAITSVGELWFMVLNSAKREKNIESLRQLLQDLVRYDFGEDEAEEFGRIKSELRRIGRPIPDPDSQIAAVARVNNLIVLTADAHFNNVTGLKIENWLS